jgi:predicted ArsR family transcriptional regulator
VKRNLQYMAPGLVDFFAAFQGKTRIRILLLLLDGEQTIPVIAKVLKLRPVNVDAVLQLMKRRGLVVYRKEETEGRKPRHVYRLARNEVTDLFEAALAIKGVRLDG